MAIAYIQEFTIVDGDTSTTNYDSVVAALGLTGPPAGLLIHTAGFDRDGGVFRIFDVWETREDGERFMNDVLNPALEPLMQAATERGDSSWSPPTREAWYDLHDTMAG
jgi:hypothetical protein